MRGARSREPSGMTPKAHPLLGSPDLPGLKQTVNVSGVLVFGLSDVFTCPIDLDSLLTYALSFTFHEARSTGQVVLDSALGSLVDLGSENLSGCSCYIRRSMGMTP